MENACLRGQLGDKIRHSERPSREAKRLLLANMTPLSLRTPSLRMVIWARQSSLPELGLSARFELRRQSFIRTLTWSIASRVPRNDTQRGGGDFCDSVECGNWDIDVHQGVN